MARQVSKKIQMLIDEKPGLFKGPSANKMIRTLELMEQSPVTSVMLRDPLGDKHTGTTNRRLNRLVKAFPETLARKKYGKLVTFGFTDQMDNFDPNQSLPKPEPELPLDEKVISTGLYLGELGFGTKSYDPAMMDGLAFYLKINDYSDQIDTVMMIGGLVPSIPPFYGVRNSEDMRFLGRKELSEEEIDLKIAQRLANAKEGISEKDIEYLKKYMIGKINNRQDALEVARSELEVLLRAVPNAEIHYHHGEEDIKNMQWDREIMITAIAESNEIIEKNQEKITKIEAQLVVQKSKTEYLNAVRAVFNYVVGQRVGPTKKKGAEFQKYLTETVIPAIEEKEDFDSKAVQEVVHYLSKRVSKTHVLAKVGHIKTDYTLAKRKVKDLEAQIDEHQRQISAAKRVRENWGGFRFTKRVQITPEQDEEIFRKEKIEYNGRIYEIVGEDAKRFHVHTSRFSDVIGGIPKNLAEELEDDGNLIVEGSLIYHLAHNPNALRSNTPTKKDLRMLKEKAKLLVRRQRIRKKYGLPTKVVPEVFLAAHGVGGLQCQPQAKYRESIEEGVYAEAAQLVMHIKLPTFQASHRLEGIVQKGIRNEHTKRYSEGLFASGAVIHQVRADGAHEVEYVDETTLLAIGMELQQENYRELKQSNNPEDKAKIRRIENRLRKKYKLNFSKIEPDGDAHLGAPNQAGRATNYQIKEAIQNYQRQHGLPDVVIINEALHGSLFIAQPSYEGDTPAIADRHVKEILEKGRRSKQAFEEALTYMRANHQLIGISHTDKQFIEWRERVLPYVVDILDQGGTAIVMSGNHYNQSERNGRDEATVLESMLVSARPYLRDQIKVCPAFGDKFGVGEISGLLPGGHKFYVAHKMKEAGKNELLGIMQQANPINLDADYIFAFDRHHTGFGHADGTTIIVGPGLQPWNSYVDQINKVSSLRGVVNVFIPTSPQLNVVRCEFVLGKTIEHSQYMESLENPVHGYRKT